MWISDFIDEDAVIEEREREREREREMIREKMFRLHRHKSSAKSGERIDFTFSNIQALQVPFSLSLSLSLPKYLFIRSILVFITVFESQFGVINELNFTVLL